MVAALALALLATGCSGGGDDDTRAGQVAADRSPTAGASGPPGGPPSGLPSDLPSAPEQSEPAPDPGFGASKPGRCFRMRAPQSRASVASGRRVSCASRPTTLVARVSVLTAPVTARTSIAQRRKLGSRVCEPAYRRAVGGTPAERATSILTWTLFTPSQAQLVRGARWVRCDVVARSGAELVALPATRPLLRSGVPEQLRVCQDEQGADLSCASPHTYRVEAAYREAGDYPDATTYPTVARARCQQLTGRSDGFWQPPSKEGWAAGDRFIRCLRASP